MCNMVYHSLFPSGTDHFHVSLAVSKTWHYLSYMPLTILYIKAQPQNSKFVNNSQLKEIIYINTLI